MGTAPRWPAKKILEDMILKDRKACNPRKRPLKFYSNRNYNYSKNYEFSIIYIKET